MKKANNLLTQQPLEGLVSALAAAAIAATISFLPCSVSAQELYRDQMNNGAGWGTNASGTDFAATFDYDYSADGIPEAPHTQAGDDATRGVKLEANLTTATVDYFTLYPLGQNFTGSWQLRFDAWMNYGTSGTTEFLGGGIGYDNVSADLLSGAQFIATGDGGSTADYRALKNGFYISTGASYPAGSLNASVPYYMDFLPSVNGSTAGTPGFQWVTWEFNVVGNIVSIFLEKPNGDRLELISYDKTDTSDGSTGATTDGNISLYYADFFTSVATPPGSTFGIIDNVVVSNLQSAVSVSVTANPDTTSMDTTQPPGVFTLTRTGNTGQALAVGYTLSGTATNGVHYQSLSDTVTFQAGASSTNINVVAIPMTPAGPTRSVILSLNASNTYSIFPPTSTTVWIADTNKPSIHIAVRDTQFYERTNDYGRFTLTRWGNTNVYLSQVNVTYGGTATEGTQFYGEANTNMSYGVVDEDIHVLPIYDGVATGPLTVTATVAPAGDNSYDVGTPATSGAMTRVDADDPPETVLWSDNFSTDSSANWTVRFATTNGAPADYCLNALPDFVSLPGIGTWPFDYSVLAVPSAPHTTDGSTLGLYMAVNKNDGQPAAAALNLYPNGQNFSGNYALRFDMFLIENDTASTTEYALFGINHDGTHTNWFRNSTFGFTGVDPTGWNFDGIFYDVESDGADLGQYVGYSSPTTAGRNPTPITDGVTAEAMADVFKTPPWTPGANNGGAPANVYGSLTPTWADVEIAQINGVIYWSINHTLVFAYTNATPYTSGNIMLGYEDGYDSIGSSGGSVIYANARVISLAGPHITNIVRSGANAEITFTANAGDVPAQFVLQSASVVTGPYADTSSTITSLGGGSFKAVKATSGSPTFYRIRRVY